MRETPIFDLDREVPELSKPWLPRIIGLIVGAIIGLILILRDENQLPAWHWPAFNGLLLIPALYVSIAIHEIGHLIAGALVGFDSGGMAIGGLVLVKSGKNWTFRFEWRSWMGGYFKPLTNTRTFRPDRFAWLIAGGPLASFALTIVSLLAFDHWRSSGFWDWLGSLFWVALFILVVSSVPFSSGLNRSDGARLYLLLRYPERALSWMSLLAVQTDEARGLRPREWNADLFRQALSLDLSASEYPYCQLMAFYRRLDEGAGPDALQHLENSLTHSARSGRLFRHVLFMEAASTSANIRKQAAQARTWLERASRLHKPKSRHVVEAGIAMCEGRYTEALGHWQSARAHVVRRKLDSGVIRFAKEKWAEYEAICLTAVQAQSDKNSSIGQSENC